VTRGAREALALALVLAAAVVIHVGSLSAPFFADDYLFLDQVRDRSLPQALASPDPLGNYLRPISRQVWFWTLATTSGESSRVFHVANLLLFLAILVMLYRLARRALPALAALAGVSVVALHQAADVPLLWVSGSQDLLAVLGSLIAIELHVSGRRAAAAVVMMAALLSKETVIFAPLVAVLLAKRPGEGWKRAVARGWTQLAVMAAWGIAWLATTAHRPAIAGEVHVQPAGFPAALLHLLQMTLAIEIPFRGLGAAFHAPPPLALIPAALAIALVASMDRGSARPPLASAAAPRGLGFVLGAGAVWAVLGAIPVAVVAHLWSAYYYLFSLCGVALAIGALVARMPPWTALLPALLIGTASENARRLSEFALENSPWALESHLNRHYFVRGMTLADRVMAQLKHLRPTVPPRSTLYFSGLPHSIAFQSGDGPLVRWAYRDSSLHSYYFTRFRLEHARRGPLYFFNFRRDSLVEISGSDSLSRIALSLMYSDAPEPARDLLLLDWERSRSLETAYRLAFLQMSLGGLDAARPWLERAGVAPGTGPTPQIQTVLAAVARGDTTSAIVTMWRGVLEHGLDPGAHALMADLLLSTRQIDPGAVEAFAVRTLAPEDPGAWRRWGTVEVAMDRHLEAVRALERYLQLAGIREDEDPQIAGLLADLRRRIPGGDIAQAELGRVKK